MSVSYKAKYRLSRLFAVGGLWLGIFLGILAFRSRLNAMSASPESGFHYMILGVALFLIITFTVSGIGYILSNLVDKIPSKRDR